MALAPGFRLGPYEIVALIGAGGMGEVYRAHDARLKRDVAIKVLPAALSMDLDRLRRFEQEAQAAGGLNHPNILAIYDVGTCDGAPYLVSELLEGETLRAILGRERLATSRAVDFAAQIAHGLAAAHDKGIVHRDLKPENLFVTTDERIKILDFGLAKLTCSGNSEGDAANAPTIAASTEPGVLLGTVGYMSPEQVRGAALDARSDIFSFGAVLYEMVAGRQAFAGASPADTMSAILRDQPSSLIAATSAVPAELDRIVWRCLDKRAEHRFQSARDLSFALSGVSQSSDLISAGAAPRRRFPRTIPAVALAFAALVAAVLGRGYFPPRNSASAGVPRTASIAVLPLANLSDDPEQEYFSDGMTEALIADLARIGGLRVISRTSTMTYKGSKKGLTLPQIAAQLNVDVVVEGTVLRSGDRVRITTQLIDAKSDRHLWANSYERSVSDVLSLQSEVARAVAQEIKVTLTPQEEARFAASRPVNPAANEAYLRGRYFLAKGTEESIGEAITRFKQATAADPSDARPYTGLADAYTALRSTYAPPSVVMPKATEAARTALRLDPGLAQAHVSMGGVLMFYNYDWTAAEHELEQAIDLSPNLAEAHDYYGQYLAAVGRHAEARGEMDRALQLDPLSLTILNDAGWVAYLGRQYDRTIEINRKVIDLDPNFWPAYRDLGLGYEKVGRFTEAIASLQKARQLDSNPSVLEMLGGAYAAAGRKDDAQRVLAEVTKQASERYVCPYEVATIHAGLGNKASTLEWLKKGLQERADCMPWARSDPKLDTLRGDPQFKELMRAIGLNR